MQNIIPIRRYNHINIEQLLKDLSDADAILSTLLKCSFNEDDEQSFTIPHEDVTVLLEMALESLAKSQDNIALC